MSLKKGRGDRTYLSVCLFSALITGSTMAAARRRRTESVTKCNDDDFRESALLIIDKMLKMNPPCPGELLDEILHSIFFLGKINKAPFSPEDILGDQFFQALRSTYPRPFALYASQLPRRSPFSCVLDMFVHLTGKNNEKQIIQRLQDFIRDPRSDGQNLPRLVSSTLCVSQRDGPADSVRYYGVSMSTSDPNPGRIMIAASCLSTWDSYVADAVMTFYPDNRRKAYFDGTIRLPRQVKCEAFSIRNGKHMDPCKSCGNLFGLRASEKQSWPYGNCAEAESLSNLLTNETEVRERTQQPSATCTEKNRQKAQQAVLTNLHALLEKAKFVWDGQYYTPKEV